MKVDIFPKLGAPAIYVAQPYGGMDPSQMEGYLVSYYEYHFLYITGIEHVESKNIQGVALMKLFFHPGTDMAQAMAETIAYVNRSRAFMPPGTVGPFIMRFDAGSVPVAQLVRRTLRDIEPHARELGSERELEGILEILARGNVLWLGQGVGGSITWVAPRLVPRRLRRAPVRPRARHLSRRLAGAEVVDPQWSVVRRACCAH